MIALELQKVTKKYGNFTAVNQLSVQVQQGEIYGLLGANGAGKTTTMRMALGIIYPDYGGILWQGKGYTKGLARQMGYLPEERGLYPKISVREQITYLAELRGMDAKSADRALKDWLERFEIPDYYNKRIEELSKGNQQKIQFIAAVIHNPAILILDEAFSGLDPVNVELLKKVVKELRDKGMAILFSTHRMDHVEELCTNIAILKKSNVVLQGNLQKIKEGYQKDRLILVTAKPVAGLQDIDGIVSVEADGNHYRMKIREADVAQAVLQLAAQQTQIYKFQIEEPSLNEIFIQAVGDHHA